MTSSSSSDTGNDQLLQEEQGQRNNKDLIDTRTEEQVKGDLKLCVATTISAATGLFSVFVANIGSSSSPEGSHQHKQKTICVSFLIATISSGAAAIILAKQYHRFKIPIETFIKSLTYTSLPIEVLIKTLTYTSLVCLIITLGYVGFVLVKLYAVAAFLLAIILPTLLAVGLVAFRFCKKINETCTNQNISPSLQMPKVTTSTGTSTEHTAVDVAGNAEEDVD